MSASRAIVILSCDEYSDLWQPIAANIKFKLAETKYPIYLISNEKQFRLEGVINIQTGFDFDWSSSLKSALGKIPETELLILLDDQPIHKKPSLKRIDEAFNLLTSHNLGTLHLRPMPPMRAWNTDNVFWYEFSNSDSYTSNVYSMWKKEVLENILVAGESPWEFEVLGSGRLNSIARSGALKNDLLDYSNLVIKGMWTPQIKKIEFELSLGLDLRKRKTISKFSVKRRIADSVFKIVQFYAPRKLQNLLFTFFRNIG